MLITPFGAVAQQSEDAHETAAWSTTGLVIGAKLGAGIGEPLNELGVTFVGELELGYALPLPEPIGRSLEVFGAGAYLAPSSEGVSTAPDPRLPGDGILTYEVTQQAAVITLGARYRIPLLDESIAPYGALGGRLYMMRTSVDGEVAAEAFGVNEETNSTFGLHVAAGIDVRLGPGALLAEVQLGYAALDDYVLRDTNFGALVLLVGYRFMPFARDGSSHERAPPPVAEPPAVMREQEPEVEPQPLPVAADEPPPQEPVVAPVVAPVVVPVVAPAEAPAPIVSAPPTEGDGTIQGNIRGFDGTALQATVTVYPINLKATTDAEGSFELNLKAGRYTVRLRAFGHASQNRTVIVNENGVTVLNAELRKK